MIEEGWKNARRKNEIISEENSISFFRNVLKIFHQIISFQLYFLRFFSAALNA
jgi:hypothetical protein